MAPITIPNDLGIIIDRYNKISNATRYYMNDVFDVIVSNNHPYGTKMIDYLVNDLNFMTKFMKLFKKEYNIEIRHNTIVLHMPTQLTEFANPVTVQDLINMIEIVKEIKAGIEYFQRNNPIE